jgi:hypothetical protein
VVVDWRPDPSLPAPTNEIVIEPIIVGFPEWAVPAGPLRGSRALEDILADESILRQFLKHEFKASEPFSPGDAKKIWDKLRELGKNPMLHDGHAGSKWPGAHISVGGSHIPVDPAFKP